jgi:hypothetical protein
MSGDLRTIQANATRSAESFLARIDPEATPHAVQAGCFGLATTYRTLAICAFLLDGDVSDFRKYCMLAERARSYFLIRVHLGMEAGDEFIAATCDDHIFDCLAAGDEDTALMVELWTPSMVDPDLDDEVKYQFSMFVRAYIIDDTAAAGDYAAALDRLGGEAAGFIGIAQGLMARNRAALAHGLSQYVEAYENAWGGPDAEVDMNTLVSIEGIGIGRLARMKGLDVDFDHRLVPEALTAAAECPVVKSGYPSLTATEQEQFREFLNSRI